MVENTANDKQKVHVDSTYVCPDCGSEGAKPEAITHAVGCKHAKPRH